MKFTSMSSRDRRALAIGALIAIPGLAGPLAVKPYWHALSAIREATSVERDRLERERRAIAALPGFPAARARASRQLDNELDRLFQSSNELVSTGDLAQYVAQAAQDNGVSLQQSETRPARTVVPGVQALQVEIHAAGDLDGILHFVHQLESGGKLVRFGVLSIDGGRGPLDAPMNTITSPIRPAAAVAATDASVPEVSSNNDVDDNSSSDAQAGTVSFSLGGIGGDGNSFGGIGVNGGGSLSIGTIVVGSNDGSDASQQLDTSPPTPVFTGKRRAAGLNRGKDGAVEVLSLSASVYGYRLSGAQWSSVNTRAKTAPSPFSREPYSLESLDAIVNHDPFNAARVRPLPSYHMAMTQPAQPPSQDSANLVRQRQQERQRFQQRLRLLGTVLGSGHGSFVMCQNGNAPPKMVHIGEQIDGYTLASLTRGTAVFTSPSGERLDLRTGLSDRSRTDAWNRRRRLGNSDQQADNGNVGQQVGQGIQNAIQQLFQGGLPPGSKVQISPSSPAPSQ